MKRTTVSLFATVAALAAVTGVAVVAGPSSDDGGDGGSGTRSVKSAAHMPVQRSAVVCPAPASSEVAETTYTAFSPGAPASAKAAAGGRDTRRPADLLPLTTTKSQAPATKDEKKAAEKKRESGGKTAPGTGPVLALKAPGAPATATTDRFDAPALTGSADGPLAPGYTVQQTTAVAAGSGRGLHGLTCAPADTSFWFPGVATAKGRQDYVHLTNPDPGTAAVVDLELHGKDGRVAAPAGEGVTVPPRSSVPVLLSTLTDTPAENLTLHVTARSGRVGAAVQASDEKQGGDWLPASEPAAAAVLPGIPADATSVRLVAFAPGGEDADLKLRFAGPTGSITPAGHETLHVRSGTTETAELDGVARGEAGSLLLTAEDGGKVVAGLRVTRGKGDKQETAFLPATAPVGARGTVADARAKGTSLSLAAPGAEARVKVTAWAAGGGSPATRTYTVRPGTTLTVEPPVPGGGGKSGSALTVETVSGGPVHAARTLTLPRDGVPAFTVQPVPDDRSTVEVPAVRSDVTTVTR
ncbi:DUF5719 family protein [Streptomyces huiliensis]|uniref:DUF5719 family protein n=1 Tax=Streptomyces huiliensis TaxID=2876027 RepID=UPI001CBBBDC8|nr:DUF5719 family protein [Streptomyces huiliensis]MBZ4324319.1 hypothetical protein [Streptomyces huiliensis]